MTRNPDQGCKVLRPSNTLPELDRIERRTVFHVVLRALWHDGEKHFWEMRDD